MINVPERTEAAPYYFKYIDQVPKGDIRQTLEAQFSETLLLFREISDEASLYRYAADKWSIRQVVGHINDTERLFVFRALWFARGLEPAQPSFDQDIAVANSRADDRSWASHVEEFRGVRAATVAFFQDLPEEAWGRSGVASGHSVTVRALAYMTAGHVKHHLTLLRERYLQS
jgi:hypothetical protein